MATAGERAMASASKLEKIGFTEFTTHLVRDVYRIIVEASMDQLKSYAEFVDVISVSLADYQERVTGASQTDKEAKADEYISNILGLTAASGVYTITNDIDSLEQHFGGVTVEISSVMTGFREATVAAGNDITITEANLRLFVLAKLNVQAKDTYNLLKTILELGMQKVVVTSGEIHTKLTFHVDATDTYEKTASDYDDKASSWGVGGSVKGQYGIGGGGVASKALGSFIGGGISGGYSSRKLSVSVVNEKSTSATNVNIDILGEVRILFRTETFPAIGA